jgi:hypothetical protein
MVILIQKYEITQKETSWLTIAKQLKNIDTTFIVQKIELN